MSNPNPKNAANQSNRPAASKPATPAPAPVPTPPVKVPPLFRPSDWISCIITMLVVFAGYLYTLAPDLTLEDCGELATGSFYAGVPHPPGYPVWTIYSWIFTWLVPISNVAYRVAISSAVAGAIRLLRTSPPAAAGFGVALPAGAAGAPPRPLRPPRPNGFASGGGTSVGN